MLSIAMRDKPAYVRCLVAFYAFMDIRQSEMHQANETAEVVKTFSPITYLASEACKIAPMFIARAGLDEVPTMNDSIDRFIREAISKNAAITVANHGQGVHGFDNQTDDGRSREIIQSVIAFMKIHLGITEAGNMRNPHLTTHWTGPRAGQSFIVSLAEAQLNASPVNSGVRWLRVRCGDNKGRR